MTTEQIELLIETPLKSLGTELEKQGLMTGIQAEIIAAILKNIRENK